MNNAQSSNTSPINVSSNCIVRCVANMFGEKCTNSCTNQPVQQIIPSPVSPPEGITDPKGSRTFTLNLDQTSAPTSALTSALTSAPTSAPTSTPSSTPSSTPYQEGLTDSEGSRTTCTSDNFNILGLCISSQTLLISGVIIGLLLILVTLFFRATKF